ncbi:MAG: N-acetyltransferase [Myxococcales bacterium]|nr:N-acetyltransferase [Myxococcales bacterium]
MTVENLQIEIGTSLAAIAAHDWDALVGADNPFVEHRFLLALETSGSVGAGTGWLPAHAVVRRGTRIVAAAPLYVKDHSYGEYIFDWGWANAAQRAGISYYPKVVCAVPFTPATGPRLLVHPDEDPRELRRVLLQAMRRLVEAIDGSSAHVLFCTKEEHDDLCGETGWLPRVTYQFHWNNDSYRDFDDYLARFRAAARKAVRRERRKAAQAALEIQTLSGTELPRGASTALYRFYGDTISRKWAHRYLTRTFFGELETSLAERVLVNWALREGKPVAATLSFQKGTQLFGRYWGAADEIEMLHFELCYYRPIEYAIERGLQRFEAGAQGQHKLKRGLLPTPTYSLHQIAHPGLERGIREFLAFERRAVEAEIAELLQSSPFRC